MAQLTTDAVPCCPLPAPTTGLAISSSSDDVLTASGDGAPYVEGITLQGWMSRVPCTHLMISSLPDLTAVHTYVWTGIVRSGGADTAVPKAL